MCLIISLLILLCLHQITSAVTVLQQADILRQATQPLPLIQVALNCAWAGVSGLTLLRLKWRSPWAKPQAVGILIGFAVYSLLRLLVWTQADYDRGRGMLWCLLLGVIGGAGMMLWWQARHDLGTRDNGESKN